MATRARGIRKKIINDGPKRLNLIKNGDYNKIYSPDPLSSNPDIPVTDSDHELSGINAESGAQSPPMVFPDLDPVPHLPDHLPDQRTAYNIVSTQGHATESNQNDRHGVASREETNLRRRGISNDPSRSSTSEVSGRPEPSSTTRAQPVHASLPEKLLASLLNVFGSVNSQQLNTAISATEQTRRILSITLSLLVLLSHFGFPVVGNKIIRSIILFRPLFLLMLMNISLVILRLQAELDQGKKEAHKSPGTEALGGSEGLGWALEAGRALEVGLMLQNAFGSLFMDFGVYALIIICGFCLAG